MTYLLITIAGFFSIVTTAIFKSISDNSNHLTLKKALVIVISILIYIVICVFLLQQKTFE
jgi:multidrug transporter EmrE-like cation transporter